MFKQYRGMAIMQVTIAILLVASISAACIQLGQKALAQNATTNRTGEAAGPQQLTTSGPLSLTNASKSPSAVGGGNITSPGTSGTASAGNITAGMPSSSALAQNATTNRTGEAAGPQQLTTSGPLSLTNASKSPSAVGGGNITSPGTSGTASAGNITAGMPSSSAPK